MLPFDPDFDDARWTLEWAKVPILQVPIGSHPDLKNAVAATSSGNLATMRLASEPALGPLVQKALNCSPLPSWLAISPQKKWSGLLRPLKAAMAALSNADA